MHKYSTGLPLYHSKSDLKNLISSTNDPLLKQLDCKKSINRYKKGQHIFIEGNSAMGLYGIKSGKIKATKTGISGKETIIRIYSKGDFLGLRSLLLNIEYAYSTTVIEDSQIWFVNKHVITKALRNNPLISNFFISKLCLQINSMENKIVSLTQKNVKQRFAELLVLLSYEYGICDNDKIRLDIKLTREEMAAIIGTAVENLIRLVTEFKKDNLISENKKTLYIEDIYKLKCHI